MKHLLRLVFVLIFGQIAATASAQLASGVGLPDPWPPGNAADTHWGVRVPDPYRELESVKDERVQRWLREQGAAGAKVLAQLPGRAALLERVKALDAEGRGVTAEVSRSNNGRLFFLRRNPDEQQFRLLMRESVDADPARDRTLVDADALSKAAGRPVAIQEYAASPDGTRLAYSLQTGGAEIGTLHVIDLASGRDLVPPLDRIRGAELSWLPDGSGFFFNRLREGWEQLPATERFQDHGSHFLSLADGSVRTVFSASRYPELGLPSIATASVAVVPGRSLAAALVRLGVDRNLVLLVADLDATRRGVPRWRKVVDVGDQMAGVALGEGVFYLRSAKDAPRYRVLRLSVDTPDIARAEVLVPATEGVITQLAVAREGLYFTRRDGVTTSLWRLPGARGPALAVPLPVTGTVSVRHAQVEQEGVLLALGGWTQAPSDYRFDLASNRVLPMPLAKAGLNDAPPGIQAREVMVRSHDGVMVPVSILSRRDLALNGRNPTLLYGYGAYGSVESPSFNPRLLAWLERGGVYAIAHVRGGGVFGQAWHEGGHKTTKPNTWKDGIAVAEWLVANGYTSRERLAVYGGSAGGIFVGRTMTERPDLFAAAVASVPVLDTVRSETRANGVANVPEYGTVKVEAEFKALLAMSSYHALKDGVRYPAVLLTHGVNDIRVDVWQSAKFAARLQAVNAGVPQARPALMRLDAEAGHGSGASRAQQQERQVDIWSFLLWQFGVPEFQPVKPGKDG